MHELNTTPFGAKVEPLDGALPRADFLWDPETEILRSTLPGVEGGRGYTGSIELEARGGAAFITLDVQGGVMCGLEVVVWPTPTTVPDLTPPSALRDGRLTVPGRPSQPGIALLELDVPLGVERSPDESIIHLRVGDPRASEAIGLADKVILEMDGDGELAGFWLLNVPPFPASEVAP